MHIKTILPGLLMSLLLFQGHAVANQTIDLKKSHAQVWNEFANNMLALHERLIKNTTHTVKTIHGGYAGMPEFYREDAYYDKKNNKLISRLQWERENPQNLHTIEVFVRDEQGRVIRDYTAAYLPTYRNAPTQTLLSFHAYNGDLHAFRTFDASAARIVERCTGMLDNTKVDMLLDEDQIYDAIDGKSNVMKQKAYQECFKGLPEEPGKYLTPQ